MASEAPRDTLDALVVGDAGLGETDLGSRRDEGGLLAVPAEELLSPLLFRPWVDVGRASVGAVEGFSRRGLARVGVWAVNDGALLAREGSTVPGSSPLMLRRR